MFLHKAHGSVGRKRASCMIWPVTWPASPSSSTPQSIAGSKYRIAISLRARRLCWLSVHPIATSADTSRSTTSACGIRPIQVMTSMVGSIVSTCSRATSTLKSFEVACSGLDPWTRSRFDCSSRSGSITTIFPTPALASTSITAEPVPPAPITATVESRSCWTASSPKAPRKRATLSVDCVGFPAKPYRQFAIERSTVRNLEASSHRPSNLTRADIRVRPSTREAIKLT